MGCGRIWWMWCGGTVLAKTGASDLRLQCCTKECRQAEPIQLTVGYPDHRFVGRQFRQRAGVHAVNFKKVQGRLNCRPFVAVKVSLAFRKMVGVGCGDFVEVAVSVEIYVLRLGYGRLQPVFIAKAGHAAPRVKLVPMNRVDLFPSEEDRFWFQAETANRIYSASRRNSPACSVLVFRWAFLNCSSEAVRTRGGFPFARACPSSSLEPDGGCATYLGSLVTFFSTGTNLSFHSTGA
jgi:hypothetical protein